LSKIVPYTDGLRPIIAHHAVKENLLNLFLTFYQKIGAVHKIHTECTLNSRFKSWMVWLPKNGVSMLFIFQKSKSGFQK